MATVETILEKTPLGTSSAPEHISIDKSSRHTPLQLFQLLIGIHTAPSLTREYDDIGISQTDNVGLYQRAKEQERASRIAYLCTSYVGNSLYMFQILLAAIFTALSAYKDVDPVTLTVLGALNTVLAGCLAWQKGQGVPQRYRKAQDQYQALLLEIEMTERSFLDSENSNGEGSVKPDPRAEKDRLQRLFDVARADQQANYPDLYFSTGAIAAKDTQTLKKQPDDAKAETIKVRNELIAKIELLLGKLEGQVASHVEHVEHAVQGYPRA